MSDRYTIRWSQAAVGDIESIVEYVGQDSPQNASLLASRIIESARRLEYFPRSGHMVPVLGASCRVLIVDSYSVLYKFDENNAAVRILAVIHQARNWPK